MGSITKNYLKENVIKHIVESALGKGRMAGYMEVDGGFCNAVYRIELTDGSRAILKVAPASDIRLMSCEVAMMRTEAGAMQLAAKHDIPHVPKVYVYDDSRKLCDAEYLLMECMEGIPATQAKEKMDDKEKEKAEEQIGKLLHKVNEITGEKFGHFCMKQLQYDNWFEAFYHMLSQVIQDGIDASIDIGVPYGTILSKLQSDRSYFEEVKCPKLIHFDSWDGNFIMRNGQISGMIDWERALWAEALMEDKFRFHSVSDAFLNGYGIKELTPSQKIRSNWYDIYLYLIMMFEVTYRHYETMDQYYWVHGLFEQVIEKV